MDVLSLYINTDMWNVKKSNKTAVHLRLFVSKCNVGESLVLIYIHILSYYKLFCIFISVYV
jgi:hypothetical protein